MRKVYHLSSCSTCQRIIKELGTLITDFTFQDIKTEKMAAGQVEEMKELSGSYESLFSRKAMKYRAMGLGEKTLGEEDYKQLIVDEYTFLKRPVFLVDGKIFIGNAKKNIQELEQFLNS